MSGTGVCTHLCLGVSVAPTPPDVEHDGHATSAGYRCHPGVCLHTAFHAFAIVLDVSPGFEIVFRARPCTDDSDCPSTLLPCRPLSAGVCTQDTHQDRLGETSCIRLH